MDKINKLEKEVAELKEFNQKLLVGFKLPLKFDQALQSRGYVKKASVFSLSAKGADTEDVSINEAGSSTKIVLNDPVGFLKVTIDTVDCYVPYYSL